MRIGIGTAQFGLDYGISNLEGKISSVEVNKILELCRNENIIHLDTACTYGDSERVLGNYLNRSDSFQIITKTPVFNKDKITKADGELLKKTLKESLKKLGRNKIYGLLVHHSKDLTRPSSNYLIDALHDLKESKLVDRIGASFYTSDEIDDVLTLFEPDIVQIPLNIVDQRLIKSGHLRLFKRNNIEVHARSIFLQGALLTKPWDLPPFFNDVKQHFVRVLDFANENGLNQLELCTCFALMQTDVDSMIIGITKASELKQILIAVEKLKNKKLNTKELAITDTKYIDPSKWKIND